MDWKSIKDVPYDEYVMVRNKEFGPYKYRMSDMQWIDPAPEEFVTMEEYMEITE